MSCDHPEFRAEVRVGRLTDDNGEVKYFTAEVEICCHTCGVNFVFLGLPGGSSLVHPTVSANGLEARMPIALAADNVIVLPQRSND